MNLKRIYFEKKLSNKAAGEIIIFLLAEVWPLSVKGLHKRSEKTREKPASFQGVYKAVNKLADENIVERKNGYYKISIEWLKQLESFSKSIQRNYSKKEANLEDLP